MLPQRGGGGRLVEPIFHICQISLKCFDISSSKNWWLGSLGCHHPWPRSFTEVIMMTTLKKMMITMMMLLFDDDDDDAGVRCKGVQNPKFGGLDLGAMIWFNHHHHRHHHLHHHHRHYQHHHHVS